MTGAPYLDCPECCHPLIPADIHDSDGWWWSEVDPVTCPCGCVAKVGYQADGGVYAECVTPAPVDP